MTAFSNFLKLYLIVGVLLLSARQQCLAEAENYQVDIAPLQANLELAAEYKILQQKFEHEPLTPAEHRRRMEILKAILATNSDWLDGYWIFAAETFFLGSSYEDPKDFPIARKVLVEGREHIDQCLKIKNQHMICKFFWAAMTAKISSYDGIVATLRFARKIRDIWEEVAASKVNLAFRPHVSLQGLTHYALGLFYRLIPDLKIMDWMFNIRGNIDQSIVLHRKAISFDGKNPCYTLMLAVALLCKVKGVNNTSEFNESMGLLDDSARSTPIDLAQQRCINDVERIRKEPRKTCGYTQAKYYDENSGTSTKSNL